MRSLSPAPVTNIKSLFCEYICVLSVCELPEFTKLNRVALELVRFLIVNAAFDAAPEVSWLIPVSYTHLTLPTILLV